MPTWGAHSNAHPDEISAPRFGPTQGETYCMTHHSQPELEGRVAVVTGGAQGIGEAICLVLAREGAHIVVADVNTEASQNVVAKLEARGARALAIKTDVSSEASVLHLYEKVLAAFGRIDILVNNAGICRMIAIADIEVEEWDRMLAVNLRGTFLMSREALRVMKENGRGKIVNIASAAAKLGGLAADAHYSGIQGRGSLFHEVPGLAGSTLQNQRECGCAGPHGYGNDRRLGQRGKRVVCGQYTVEGIRQTDRSCGGRGLSRLGSRWVHHGRNLGCEWRSCHGLGDLKRIRPTNRASWGSMESTHGKNRAVANAPSARSTAWL